MASNAPFALAAAAGGAPLLLRQLFDAETSTFIYLLADVASRQGVLIDSVYEQHPRDLSLIRELGIQAGRQPRHPVHADHVTGSWRLHRATGCAIALAAVAGAENVTLPLRHGDRVSFGGRLLEVRATPGHTDGCLSVVLDDPQRGLHRRCPAGAGLRPLRLSAGGCRHPLPLDHRAAPFPARPLPALPGP
ncbi:hypothetical protein VB738_15465 [Cyanobium gracile UHCC 0139]|uniref:Uncharacterized protein n=1 Tax=Cyanobium gracile UHCC 0139 TaxID=3110308 RepID=A0ABU5RY18_9CYAN|nr:hypothetical protein [Cyanobium gracile]MEA5392662.1 hypothetical protein [Cyanobium gracile UHCC 0139]